MTLEITRGVQGLYYGTNKKVRGLFVAGRTEEEVRNRAVLAELGLQRTENCVEEHIMHTHLNGFRTFVPIADWQTEKQKEETIEFLKRFIQSQLI